MICVLAKIYTATAQTDSLKTQQLNEITVSANRHVPFLNGATPVQLLDVKDLQRLNSLSVADALRFFSGIQLKDYGGVGGLKTINVRSMGTNHTGVFYNGIQLANAQNGQVDLGKFSLENIEEISLFSGQNPELLQTARAYSSASSLYLKTKVPQFKSQQKQDFKFVIKSGSFGLVNPSLNYNQKLNKKSSLNINGELTQAHGRYKYRYTNGVYDTTVVRQNTDIDAKRLESSFYHQFTDSAKLQIRAYYYNSERGLPGAIVSNKFEFTQRQWNRNFFLQANYQSSHHKNFQWLIHAKYGNDYLRYADPDYKYGNRDGYLINTYNQQEYYTSIANKYKINSYWVISWANDYSRQELDANLINFAYPTRHTWLSVIASEWKWNRLDFQANILHTYVNDLVKKNEDAGNKAIFTPTFLTSWQPFNNTGFRVRAFYKSIFRMPTFNDLYYTFVGNSNLDPELAKQLDIGFYYNIPFTNKILKSISFSGDIYNNDIKDKIVAIPTTTLFRWTMVNLDKVNIKGAEFQTESTWKFKNLVNTLKANYTYEKALDLTKTGYTYRHQIPYIPVHSGSITLASDYKSWGTNYSFIYTGERYSQKANIRANYIPAWYTHDFAIHKNFQYSKSQFKASIEVNNFLNQYYDVVLNYPMPGTNYRISLSANF